MQIQNIDILVSGTNSEGYVLRITESPQGRTTGAAGFLLTFAEDGTLGFLENALARSIEDISSKLTAEKAGTSLYKAMIYNDEVQDIVTSAIAVAASRGDQARVRFQVEPPELRRLPWELLYRDPGGFLVLSATTSVARYVATGSSAVRTLLATPPLKVLIVGAAPAELPPLNMDSEIGRIRDAVSKGAGSDQIEIHELRNPPIGSVRALIREQGIHVLHFIGHGSFNDGEPVLALTDASGKLAPVDAEVFAANIAGLDTLRLAVLNACDSAVEDTTQPLLGIAPRLIQRAALPAVLAMQTAVRDDSAIAFSQAFYQQLASGQPVDNALREGRLAVFTLHGTKKKDFAIPVLFLRPAEARLIDFPTQQVARIVDHVSSAAGEIRVLNQKPQGAGETQALQAWGGQLGGMAALYTRLADWKDLHDLLHELENTFELVFKEIERLDPNALELTDVYDPWTLCGTQITRIKTFAGRAGLSIATTRYVELPEGGIQGDPWSVDIVTQARRLDAVLAEGSVSGLRRTARDMRQTIQTHMTGADKSLSDDTKRLEGLTDAWLRSLPSAESARDSQLAAVLASYRQTADDVTELHRHLFAAVRLHDLLQDLTGSYRRVRDETRGAPSRWDMFDVDDAWRYCRSNVLDSRMLGFARENAGLVKTESAYTGAPWAVELFTLADRFDTALASAVDRNDLTQIGSAVRLFDTAQRQQFYMADKSLRDITRELQKLSAQVLAILSAPETPAPS